ncbi:helix-turn-helix domain-containing protein [Rhizobium ruizarguesonis]
MTADEFKAAIDTLGYSQVGISRLFGVNDRTGRRWASGEVPIPEAAATCLKLMLISGLTPEVMGKIASNRVGNEFGQPDEIQYRWILPKFVGAEWTVARHFHSRQTFLVPGSAAELKLSEIHFGPRIYPPETVEKIG